MTQYFQLWVTIMDSYIYCFYLSKAVGILFYTIVRDSTVLLKMLQYLTTHMILVMPIVFQYSWQRLNTNYKYNQKRKLFWESMQNKGGLFLV